MSLCLQLFFFFTCVFLSPQMFRWSQIVQVYLPFWCVALTSPPEGPVVIERFFISLPIWYKGFGTDKNAGECYIKYITLRNINMFSTTHRDVTRRFLDKSCEDLCLALWPSPTWCVCEAKSDHIWTREWRWGGGPDWNWLRTGGQGVGTTCQSQASHVLQCTLLYRLIFSKCDHILQNRLDTFD